MSADGLDPPGEQLELFPEPDIAVTETVVHRAQVAYGIGSTAQWRCTCGQTGPPTTWGRARGGRLVHLRAARKRNQERADRP